MLHCTFDTHGYKLREERFVVDPPGSSDMAGSDGFGLPAIGDYATLRCVVCIGSAERARVAPPPTVSGRVTGRIWDLHFLTLVLHQTEPPPEKEPTP